MILFKKNNYIITLFSFGLFLLSHHVFAQTTSYPIPVPIAGETPSVPVVISTPKYYGQIKDTSQLFDVVLDPDLWSRTDKNSFIVTGEVKAFVAASPKLAVVYGVAGDKLTHIAPTLAPHNAIFSATLAKNDTLPFTSPKITVTSIEKDIQNNTVFFAVVDALNPEIAYTDVQTVELGLHNTGKTSYGLEQHAGTSKNVDAYTQKGGLLDGICSDVHTCGYNDLLALVTSFWKFIIYLIIPLMAFMTAWIGYNFMQNGAEYREKAKEMAFNMVKGIILVLFAWFIVNTILTFTLGKDSCYSFLGKGSVDPTCLDKNK